MKKRPDLTQATRQHFIDAFCEIYKSKPVEKITVREIAEKAGHNRVTFYQYFRDAYDVLESMENELLEYLSDAITANIKRNDMFDEFASVFNHVLTGKPTLLHVLLTGANCGKTLERCKTAMLPVITDAFSVDENDYKGRAVFEFYLSGIVSMLKFKIEYAEQISTQEIGEIIKYILQNGILPQALNAEN